MNKKLLSIITSVLAFANLAVYSQTNATTVPVSSVTSALTTAGVGTNTATGIGTILNSFVDASPYFTNGNVLIEMGALKNGSHYGGFIDAQVPVNTNSWQLTYGVTAAYLNHSFYSAAADVGVGTTVTIPGFSQLFGPLYAYTEAGAGYNWKDSEVITQAFAGVRYQHAFSSKWSFVGSYGIGTISDVSGKVQEFSLGAIFHF